MLCAFLIIFIIHVSFFKNTTNSVRYGKNEAVFLKDRMFAADSL